GGADRGRRVHADRDALREAAQPGRGCARARAARWQERRFGGEGRGRIAAWGEELLPPPERPVRAVRLDGVVPDERSIDAEAGGESGERRVAVVEPEVAGAGAARIAVVESARRAQESRRSDVKPEPGPVDLAHHDRARIAAVPLELEDRPHLGPPVVDDP